MKHKIFTLFFAMMASVLTLFAANGTCGDNLTWDLTNGVLTISGTGDMTDYTNMSSNITPWYSSRTSITSVVIGNGVTHIGNYAFYNCTKLISANIPNSVTSIGADAFYKCNSLTSVTIPNSVTDIGDLAFYGAIAGPLYNSHIFAHMPTSYAGAYTIPSGIERIAGAAFSGCKNLTSVTIPNSVTSIGSNAFYQCSSLTAITIPNSVTSIEEAAFASCKSLTSVTIPLNVTSIGLSAFSDCTSLTSITWNAKNCSYYNPNNINSAFYKIRTQITSFVFGDEVEQIPTRLCYEMSGLSSITIPESVTSIGSSAFYGCTGLTSVTIPNNVTSIGSYAFYGCAGLASVTMGNNVTSIGESAFSGCTGLTSITIPSSVTSIGSNAFSGCNNITSVVLNSNALVRKNYSTSSTIGSIFGSQVTEYRIGNSVTGIGNYAFYNCKNISSITIGDNVTSIGSYAFNGCTGLTSITIPNSVTSIGTYAFNGCTGLTSITIPENVTNIGVSAFSGCSSLTSVVWNAKNCANVSSYKDAPFYNVRTQITSFTMGNEVENIPSCLCYEMSNLTSITIPNSVTSIGSSAFYGCTGLTSITIPNNVTSIGTYAFNGCIGLTSITIPSSVTSIGSNAFSSCNNITSVTLNSNAIVSKNYSTSSTISSIFGSQVTEYIIGNSVTGIGNYAFYNCKNISSITIGDNVTNIGSYAFNGCSGLTSITIPSNVTSIGSSAFNGCTGLTSITIPSSVTSIGSNAYSSCNITTINYIGTLEEWCNKNWYSTIISSNYQLLINGVLQEHITIPNNLTTINSFVFRGCNSLQSIEIPNGVTTVEAGAFKGCAGLTSVVWNIVNHADFTSQLTPFYRKEDSNCTGCEFDIRPQIISITFGDDVEYIPAYLCYGITNISSITIPNSVTSIGNSAFSGCAGLASVTMGNNVTSIGNSAFYGCSGLASVTMGNNVTSIGQNAFYNCTNLNSITIPNSVTSIGSNAFKNCTNLTSVEWDANQYELTGQIFPATLKTLIIGQNYDTINLKYLPAEEVILRNPMTVVTNIPRATTKLGLYDIYGTGEMLAVNSDNKNVVIENLYGTRLDTIGSNINTGGRLSKYLASSWISCNINNDSVIDVRNEGAFYESNTNGEYSPHDFVIPYSSGVPLKYNHIFQLDANLDGLQDFYVYENNKHYFQLRQWDGSYLKSELNILTDTSAIDSTIYQKWEKESDELFFITSTWDEISLKNTMFIAPGDPDDYYSTGFDFIDMAIDLDRNGLVDLLSSTTGAVLYNLGDNTYVKGSFPGSVTPKDLNGDGVLDYVIYNKSTKTISLQIYEKDGTSTTKTLMQNMNISNVWCYDFDNDGDVDILLPFDWTSTSGYAFLVFWRNDGNNTFKKIENAFDDPIKHFQFLDCRDVDNDGKYEIIARDSLDSYTAYNTIHNGNYYLIRYNNRFKVSLDEPFVANSLSKSLNDPLFVCGDFNNDGINDYYYTGGEYGPYTLAHFPYAAINTPPAKMSKPRIKVNAEKAMLSIDWDRGSDAQTSSLDLEYSIRIGSKPGACDLWFAAANADGKQRSLWGANVGSYLNQKVNVSTWKEGDYYISVQAIDPNGLGGEWSDEVVYHHTLLSFGFNISNHNIKTTDTITVQFAGAVDESNTYNWDFGEGAVVISQYGQTYTIIYTTQGNKHISLQMTSADGRKSPLVTQEVNVLPLRFEKNPNYPNNGSDPYFTLSYFDMDMDGVMDGIGYQSNWSGYAKLQQGFFKGRGDGSFIKLAKTYNADLQVTGSVGDCVFADVNMDGLPDVVTQTSKGSIMYNMEDFDVDFSNDTYTLPSTPAPQYDFNNDGRADTYSIKNEHTILLHLQTDDEAKTVEVYLPSDFALNSLYKNDLIVGHDFDNNGFIDFISTGTKSGTNVFIIYLHDDYSVTCQYIKEGVYSSVYHVDITPFADLNSDGVPDLNEYILKSNIANEAPAVPTNLRAVQENDGVYLYWDAAKDKETPAAQMRYNISVKKKGVAVGTDNAFIVSPMNGLYDEAAIIPGYYYPHGTSYFIPIDKLTGGQTYEFQIQSIDLWSAHSPMSAVYTFTVQPQVLISMPAQTCVNEPVTVAFTGTNNSGISWNFDGGVASQNTDGSYSVYWATEGVKTVKATLSGNTSSRVIYVQNAQKDLFFALPERVLSNSWTEVTLPAVYENLEHLAIRTSANCTGYVLPKKDSRIFQVCFKSTSTDDSEIGWVEFYQNDAFCGEMNTFRASTRIIGNGTAPVISLVMVDATTGKNMITWDTPANLPSYIDSMIIYKEEGKANNWVKQAKVPISAGQWIDQASDPSVKSNSYCIAYTSIYGGESPKSAAHKTPHLQTNYGLNGAINLYWTFYQGDVVDSYQILRGTSSSNMQVLATVAGDECTYTDNSPVENAYYAIAYSNAAFVNEWSYSAAANAPSRVRNAHMRTTRSGHSNIMLSTASVQATLAQSLNILSMERAYTLSPSRTTLHLYAEVTPSGATFKQVKWSIVSGTELASINSNGLLVANTVGLNGTVTVRATAIDGSGVYAERDITVSGMTPIITYYTIRFLNWNGEVLQSSKVAEGEMPVYTGATPTRAGENQYTYTFTGWSPAIVAATANADYTAQYDATAHYTIRFLNWDGTVLQSELLKEGAMPTYKGTTPTHAESDNYTYTFTGWKPEIVSVTANADYTAQYDSLAVQYYTIRFLNWDSTVLQTELLKVGTMPVYKGETPTKEETEYESYTFRTWTPMVHTVTGDADYVAIYYISYIPHYFIQFLNWDGTVLQKEHLRADVMPTYKKETPVRAENDYYTYTFKGWKPEIVPVVADVDYIAQYDSVAIPYYTIRFLNWDGTVLQSESLKVGTMPTYKGTAPVHGQTGYYFSGWTPTIVAASANADYTAVYKTCEDMHLAWMIQDDGRSMGGMQYTSSWNYEYFSGASVLGAKSATLLTPKVNLTNMTSIKLTFNHRYEGTMNPSECLTLLVCTDYKYSINDKWEELTIPSYSRSFEDVTVEVPSKYAKANTVFAFDYFTDDTNGRWQIRNVRLDASCVESVDPTYYTIRFLNYDGTELQSSQVEEGEMPVYTGATPTRVEDEQYTYTFKGWSPAIVAATANADYTAQFTATEKPVVTTHTVTVLSNDQTMGSVTGSGVYEQGSNVTISAQPNTGYRFSCWDDGFIPSDAISATEASSIASALASYETTADTYTVVGYVTRAYGNYTNSYYLADTPDGQGQFVVFKANASANIGDHVMVTGTLTNYRGTTPETTEGAILKPYPEYGAHATRTITVNSDTTITAIFVPSEPVITTYTVTVLSNDQTMGTVTGSGVYEKGTTVNISAVPHPGYHFTYWDDELAPSDAISATEAISIASALESNEITDVKYTIVGYVVAAYGNIVNSYYLADIPDGQGQFVVYKANALANIGDHVMVTGKLTNYRGTTPETTEGAILKQYPEYGANATRTITVNSDMTITAIFAPASGTDIQKTEWQQKAVKIIREDKVFILRGGKLYTVTGQEVK